MVSISKANKVSRKHKGPTHPDSIRTQKVIHTCGILGLTTKYNLFHFQESSILKAAAAPASSNLQAL